MPQTRSQRSATTTPTSGESTGAGITDPSDSSIGASSGTGTVGTDTITRASVSDTAVRQEATSEVAADPSSSRKNITSPNKRKSPANSTSSRRRRELVRAKEELLQRQVELAAARVAALEEDSAAEDSEEEHTVRDDRTSAWVQSNSIEIAAHAREKSAPVPEAVDQPPEHPRRQHASMPEISRYDSVILHQADSRNRAPCLPPRTPFDYTELAAAIAYAARSAQPAPRTQELPFFNGASSDWLPFKAAYEESARLCSEQDNLARLRRCLKGAAREAAQCLFIGSTTTDEVMKLLSSRFGRPDALVMAEINKLRALPRLTENPRDICVFASKISNVTATVKALRKQHYLYNAEVVRGVVEKLPSALRYRYYDFAAEQPEEQPDLITLTAFLEQTAERCGSFAPAENIGVEDRREPSTAKRLVRNFHTQELQSNSENQIESKPQLEKYCEICKKDNHKSIDCRNFKKAEVSARWDMAKEHKLCFRCLQVRKFRHNCKMKRCGVDGCEGTHHPLLHRAKAAPTHAAHSASETADIVTTTVGRETVALLKILPVQVTGPRGCLDTYALLDDGSTCTLIEASTAEKIGATGPPEPFYIEGVAGTKIDASAARRVRFHIRGRNSESHDISARTMNDLRLSPQTVTIQLAHSYPHLHDLERDLVYEAGKPTILVGQDNWQLLIAHEVRHGGRHEPAASLTDLGWVLHGSRPGDGIDRAHHIHHLVPGEDTQSIEVMMREHFDLESIGVQPRLALNKEEQRALHILTEKTRELPAGGFETGLLWRKDDPAVPDSYPAALRRLELLEKRLDKNSEMKIRYRKQLQVFLDKGYAEIAPLSKPPNTWYLPHFAVVNPQKPDKLRIVHDAAAKAKGVSLNDLLLSGPDLLQTLPGVLMRFRQHPVAVAADIQEMFLRISIIEEDRDMQRFLWRDDRSKAPTEYRMKSVIFGATSSPSTAIYVKNANAERFRDKYPEAAQAIVRNHYVDDYLTSFDSEERAIEVSRQVAEIHKAGNFILRQWASNSSRVRNELAPDSANSMVTMDTEKILGMVWHTQPDTLSFNINLCKIPATITEGGQTPTKREALRTVMSIYDPLGIATPVTIQAKRILQDTWKSGIEWDDKLQQNEADAWRKWMNLVGRLSHLAVPRAYPFYKSALNLQLHTFVDASASAYAAVTYWRAVAEDGTIHTALVAGKGRVAPLKIVSIPRLELQAAVLGCRLAGTVSAEHDIPPAQTYFWSDSRTVLAWIRTGPRAFKPFVAHRLAEIAETTKTAQWRWVPTKLNVADDATRETPHDFDSEHRWCLGPAFLRQPESEWPRQDDDATASAAASDSEERVSTIHGTSKLVHSLPDVARFSKLPRLLRATARVLQFIDLIRKKDVCATAHKRTTKNAESDPAWSNIRKRNINKMAPQVAGKSPRNYKILDATYIHRAQSLWVRAQQQELFSSEIDALQRARSLPSSSRLAQLSLLVDSEGVLRLRSRVAATEEISPEQRAPPVLDGDHPWTRLYIAWTHAQLHHGGFEITTTEVRQHFWVLRLRYAVRSSIKKCQFCRLHKAKPAYPSTGDHPPSRLAHHRRPFTYTGVDYFGPLSVTVGRSRQKRYGVLFTCLTTRAVHLELAGSLTTDSAVMALRRFIGRRGCPTEIWSDHGTNLKGADVEMRKAATDALSQESSIKFIRWRYIPPSAPFMGGAWERLVRSVKTALQVTLQERAPKEEVLATLLAEAESTINSRPLTHVSTAVEDGEALTPNHFLLGGPSRVPLPGTFTDADIGRRDWRTSQRLADMFWARWVREYLPELQHRREPRARGCLKLGDLVLIADGTLPRNVWPRGVIVATYPGPDGEVRAVDVRTARGVLRRPTKKLAILHVDGERDGESRDREY